MMSVVICTRNDDHGGQQAERLFAFTRSLAEQRRRYDWDVELVVVEWNPPCQQQSLSGVIGDVDGLPMRYVIVPFEIHMKYSHWEAVPVFFHIGTNVGVRWSEGDWILTTSQDVIFSDRLARFLALENLSMNAFYRATRMNTGIRELPEGKTLDEWLSVLSANVTEPRDFLDKQILHTRASGDFILMHKAAWHELRGYPECATFGTFLDGLVLHSAYLSGYAQVALDPTRCAYHMHHGDQTKQKLKPGGPPTIRRFYRPLCNWMLEKVEPLNLNNEWWGLADCESEQIGNNVWKIVPGKEKARGVGLPEWLAYQIAVS